MDSTQVNWAEIADKLINKTGEGLEFLIDKIQEIAPYAWEIALRQVYAEAIANCVLAILFTTLGIIALRICIKVWLPPLLAKAKDSYSYDEHIAPLITTILIGIATGVSVIFSIVTIGDLITTLINPDYYAILKIMEMAGLK